MVRPTHFEIGERSDGEVLTVWISGELDLASVPVLQERLDGLTAQPPAALRLDLSELSFMDSSGLRLLIALDQRAARERWDLMLIVPRHESTRAVLQLTGADRALPFEDPASR
jgi:anti-sigma B factor antagonist